MIDNRKNDFRNNELNFDSVQKHHIPISLIPKSKISMNLTRTAFGTWNGGRFMNFGEPVEEGRFIALIQRAYERGIRTFMTADTYG